MLIAFVVAYTIIGAAYLLLCRWWIKWLWGRLDEREKDKESGGWSPGGAPAYKGPPMPPVKPPKPAPPQIEAFWDQVELPFNTTGFECGWCKKLSFVPAVECPHCGAQMRNAGVWE